MPSSLVISGLIVPLEESRTRTALHYACRNAFTVERWGVDAQAAAPMWAELAARPRRSPRLKVLRKSAVITWAEELGL